MKTHVPTHAFSGAPVGKVSNSGHCCCFPPADILRTAAGFGADGLPLSVQLVGRMGAEDTLYSLAGQIEAARPWADQRPPGV